MAQIILLSWGSILTSYTRATPVVSNQVFSSNLRLSSLFQSPRRVHFGVRGGGRRGEGRTYLGEHLLLGELANVLDGLGGSLLELNSLESLVQVERVIAARWLHLSLFSHHN